ncbi:MAG: hypothetical protein K2P94_12655 [Rhodospirillaceae bacterium]|nr:hypothetical protein [Rhodospirillaceae bacterium]
MALLRQSHKAKGTAWLILGLGAALSGCGTTAYVDSRREAGQTTPVGMSNPNRVAICYSKSATAAAEVEKLAESECARTGRVPQFSAEERWGCTMIAPRRVFYSCVAKP